MRMARYLALLSLLPTPLFAWGAKGHSVIAELAERGLSPAAAAVVRDLNYNAPLRDIASLPDDWRGEETRKVRTTNTGAWHYSNIPNDQATFDRARDCKDDNCIVAAIEKYTAILADKKQSKEARREALVYVVHFVGDIHQPMHAAGGMVKNEETGELEPDRGGNSVKLRYLGTETNLHSMWDSMLIEWGKDTVEEYVEYLLEFELRGRPIAELQTGSAVDWINESHYTAVNHAYAIGNGRIGAAYAQRNIGVVYERLVRGGLRLRKLLDDALTGR
ncbi:MAG TPA: S1/P1 nuclease [Thermoanaerobaculia bacterium]|nr:S1/P1 nuclease [Thermoanaerobaculia bacterium]